MNADLKKSLAYVGGLLLILGLGGVMLVNNATAGGAETTKTENTKLAPDAELSKDLYDYNYTDIEGKVQSLSQYKGKKILFVNVASECGYTKQYESLQAVYEKHKDKLVIIGFPCNQFGGQEPGAEAEIQTFCKKNYGVTFPLSSKVSVKGSDKAAIYKWLTEKELNGVEDVSISWNFNKILVDENGKFLKSFGSGVKPDSDKIIGLL